MKRDEWVRVKSESELRAGMCLQLLSCVYCGGTHRFILLRREHRQTPCDGPHGKCLGWETTPRCTQPAGLCGSPTAIREGRLYRLADSQLTEDETTRELERVR